MRLSSVTAVAVSMFALSFTQVMAASGEVNVYSYRQPFLIKPMFDAFTRQTGVKVNVVFAKTGLVERLKREGRNSPADLIFTVDIGRLQDAEEAGLTEPVRTDVLEGNIPSQYRDPEGNWYGLTSRARIIVASRERVADGGVSRYEDLVEPAWAGRICMRSGKHVYNVALIASLMANNGEDQAADWVKGVKRNLARKPQGNDRAQVKAISEGVCDVAIINHYYMGNMLSDEEQAQWANSVAIVFPNQDDRGTHVNISGMALTKSAPNRDNAIELMEFLSSDLAQRMYAEQNFEYPVRPGTQWSGLLESFGQFKADDLPLTEVAKRRSAAVRLVDQTHFDQ